MTSGAALAESAAGLRNLLLGVPLAAACVVLWLKPSARSGRPVVAAVLSGGYVWISLAAVQAAVSTLLPAGPSFWWTWSPSPVRTFGIPLEVSLGWAVAWGVLPGLVGGRPWWWLAAFAWVDVVTMPRLDSLVALGSNWWLGEALLLLAVAAPALILAEATRRARLLGFRVVMQVGLFTGLVGWGLPTMCFTLSDHAGGRLGNEWAGSWSAVATLPLAGRTLALAAALGFGVPALAAVAELARVGGGTPFPWDPPERLVASGPYAYLANPMQVGATGLLGVLALATWSLPLMIGTVGSMVFSQAVARPHEERVLARRWPEYAEWRRSTPAWVPGLRPARSLPTRGVLSVDSGCAVCRDVGIWAASAGVTVRPADGGATRLSWTQGSIAETGVAAWARAAEARHLGWAWIGWLIRLPLVLPMVQLVADARGLGPRPITADAGSG